MQLSVVLWKKLGEVRVTVLELRTKETDALERCKQKYGKMVPIWVLWIGLK